MACSTAWGIVEADGVGPIVLGLGRYSSHQSDAGEERGRLHFHDKHLKRF